MVKKKNIQAKAIIFDMDGVIVDSMPYHFIAWYETLRPLGVQVKCVDIYCREGEKWEKTLSELLEGSGIPLTPQLSDTLFKRRSRIFKRLYKLYLFNGVEEFINDLKNMSFPLALVTGTNVREMRRILPERIRKTFDVIVTGDQLKRGKPYPDPFLRAARLLELKPEECVVIENAPLGIHAAKAAGMFCFAVATSLPPQYLKEADIVVEDIKDIQNTIKKK